MTYNEWLDLIELVKNHNRNIDYLNKMKESIQNSNINELLEPKLIELVTEKTTKALKRILNNLNEIFKNPNSLTLSIRNLEKDKNYIFELCHLKQIKQETQIKLINAINEEINNIYNILEKKSLEIDKTGMYKRMIEKMINKGDKNEI